MVARSERVKCVDVHPNEPWILSCQYNGQVLIWNYETQVNSFILIFCYRVILFCTLGCHEDFSCVRLTS